MTQQYLSGELSVLLARLHDVATGQHHTREVERLRQQAETLPVRALGWVTLCALNVTEALCWESLACGDMAAFRQQAEVSAQVYEFGVCAGLLTDE